jgi:hypothetical protein
MIVITNYKLLTYKKPRLFWEMYTASILRFEMEGLSLLKWLLKIYIEADYRFMFKTIYIIKILDFFYVIP